MAEILLEGMEFYAYHGCFKEEEIIGTKFKVDLLVKSNVKAAENSDDLKDTIDYQALYRIVKEQMEIRADLLEHVCRRILDAVIGNFPQIQYIRINVSKLNPPLGGKLKHVRVTMEHHGKDN